jgi:hypothetical protein
MRHFSQMQKQAFYTGTKQIRSVAEHVSPATEIYKYA